MTVKRVRFWLALVALALAVGAAIARTPDSWRRTSRAHTTVYKPPNGC